MDDTKTCKLVLLGNGSVGKTSIIERFRTDGFIKIYKQTVGCDFVEKTLDIRGAPCKISVWDIGGQSINSDNLKNYVEGADGIFFCYDVTDSKSFDDLGDWHGKVEELYDKKDAALEREFALKQNPEKKKSRRKCPKAKRANLYLTGNKIDLIAQRQVTENAHVNFITDSGLKDGFFVSAGSGENVLTAFYKVAAETLGITLSGFELEFTKKVLGVKIFEDEAGGKGKLKGSAKIEEEDKASHEAVMAIMNGEGGGGGGCNCVLQ